MRMIATRLLLPALISVVAVDAHGQPQGAAPVPTFVLGPSACPEASAVAKEAIRLTPPGQRSIYESGVRVQLNDLGDRYAVRIFAPGLLAEKTYLDPARDCVRRTTFAAVMVLMTLMPPQLAQQTAESEDEGSLGEPSASGQAQQKAANPTPNGRSISPGALVLRRHSFTTQTLPSRRSWLRLSLGPSATWAPPVFDALSATSLGMAFKGSVGRGSLSPFVAASFAMPSDFVLKGISGTIRRWPISVGLDWRPWVSAIDLRATLGIVTALERIRGEDLATVHEQTAVEFGARAGASVAYGRGLVAPFLAWYLDLYPQPKQIRALPRGDLGTTPALEIWVSAGAQLGL